MNKAFIKESDGDEIRCPGCESAGVAVGQAVLDHQIQTEFRSLLGDHAWFCRYAGCPVAYFNNWAGQVLVSQLRGPVYPKSPGAPLCRCFPFSMEEIEADAQEPVPHRIRELYAKSRTPEARCSQLAPDGQCCLTEIQRIYFRLKQAKSSFPTT
jgi:Zinc binding domain